MAVKEFEREYLLRAIAQAAGRRLRAAEMLGISRKSLWEKLRMHGINDAEIEASRDRTRGA
jgi:DNA-binding NtrC family response regulator